MSIHHLQHLICCHHLTTLTCHLPAFLIKAINHKRLKKFS
nr:MAG TPA: hypothetical protein [Caudoviricetes sp.]